VYRITLILSDNFTFINYYIQTFSGIILNQDLKNSFNVEGSLIRNSKNLFLKNIYIDTISVLKKYSSFLA